MLDTLSADAFVAIVGLVGMVIIITALLSGLIERSGLPQVAVFLGLGAVLGPAGLGLLEITLESPILRVVAILSLVLVLFTDAVSLKIDEIRRHALLAFLVLGPGTLLSAALIALTAWRLLDLTPAASLVLGAALASTDPVLLRGLLRAGNLPNPVRQGLRLESGLNDVVLLPVVLVAMVFMGSVADAQTTHWGRLALDLFLLGPGAGVAVGLVSVATLDLVRRRIGVRRDYESLYSLGVVFAAYAAAEALHGSGFLAVFAAGLTISALDVELCDCFIEYGETTAEMALLFAFVLFGSSLIWSGFTVLTGHTLLFAFIVLLIRPVAFLLSLTGSRLSWRERLLIAWFGPRGLSSLLLILLPVFAGIAGSKQLFELCCLVVLLSVALHGGSLMLLGRGLRAGHDAVALPAGAMPQLSIPVAPAPATPPPALSATGSDTGFPAEFITLNEMQALQRTGAAVLAVDARSEKSFESSDLLAGGAVRIRPGRENEDATQLELLTNAWLIAFCACPSEETSGRVARELRKNGWPNARALIGGWDAWIAAGLPVVPK